MSRLFKKPPRPSNWATATSMDTSNTATKFDRGVLTQVRQGQGKTNWQVRDRLQSDFVALRAHARRAAAQRDAEATAQAAATAARAEKGYFRGTYHRPTNPLNSGPVPTPPPAVQRAPARPWLVPERERIAEWRAKQSLASSMPSRADAAASAQVAVNATSG